MTRPSRSRDKRAQRHQVQAMKRMELDGPSIAKALRDPWLVTDDDMTDEEAFSLHSGEAVNPRQPWLLPTTSKEN